MRIPNRTIKSLDAIAQRARSEVSLKSLAGLIWAMRLPRVDDQDATEHWAEISLALTAALHDAGRIDEEDRFFLVAWVVESLIHEGRWMNGCYDDQLESSRDKIRAVEEKLGLAPGELWRKGQEPPEYREAHEAYHRVLDRLRVHAFVDVGESELADLLEGEPDEYRRRFRRGRDRFFPPSSGDYLDSGTS